MLNNVLERQIVTVNINPGADATRFTFIIIFFIS